MSDLQLPGAVVTELPAGVRYRLPLRQLGPYRLVGLALVVCGLVLCSAPIVPAWEVFQALGQQIPAGSGLLWLGACILGAVLCKAGLRILAVGLFILAGHSEIELRDGTLHAIECCGPVRWTWRRCTSGLRRFFVSAGLESLNAFGRLSIGPLGTRCVITPEWQPAVGGPRVKPMWLAPGYPREWLVALAADLARRCSSAAAAAEPPHSVIPVLEQEPDFSDCEELTERPLGSRIALEQSAEGLRLIVPPGIRNGPGWSFAGAFLCFMAFAFFTKLFEGAAARDMPLWLNVLLFAVTAIAGVAFIVGQIALSRRRVELAVHGDVLTIRESNPLRVRQRQWRRDQVADVFVVHHLDSDGPDHWELQVQPYPGGGSSHRLLAYQDVSELRWLATLLRRALRCPGGGEDSPSRRLVVRSPWLIWRPRGPQASG
jgi:hypothetical protein